MRTAIVALACAVLLAAPARAAENGQLAVAVADRLATLNADGSGERTLWSGGGGITEPVWAPAGNRIAFVQNGRVLVYDVRTGRVSTVTSPPDGSQDANPAWSSDGARIGFRRGDVAMIVAADGSAPARVSLPTGTVALAWAPDLSRFAAVAPPLLVLPGLSLTLGVSGTPAWSPAGDRVAFVGEGGGLAVVAASGGLPVAVTGAPVGPPRWSPDGRALVYAAGDEVRTVPVSGGDPHVVARGLRAAGADWQPCVAGTTVSCMSVAPPRCTTTAIAATTQSDQAVDLPPWPCADPAGLPLSLIVARAPEHGTLDGARYTPAPGFAGQDGAIVRLSNGVVESEALRVTIFVVPRPVATLPPLLTPTEPARAPFLSARAKPRLDRRRRTRVRLSCDATCTIAVRLTARVRGVKRKLRGRIVHRTLPARRVVSVRLRLPRKPRGRVRSVWITGTVRNADGSRRVKLPVASAAPSTPVRPQPRAATPPPGAARATTMPPPPRRAARTAPPASTPRP